MGGRYGKRDLLIKTALDLGFSREDAEKLADAYLKADKLVEQEGLTYE